MKTLRILGLSLLALTLALGLSAALNAEIPEPRFGVFRM